MHYGSFIAVLKDGTHRTGFGIFPALGAFHKCVYDALHEHAYNISYFAYAFGGEMQRYTPSEVREVYRLTESKS